jgi:hypothetical protein
MRACERIGGACMRPGGVIAINGRAAATTMSRDLA